LTAILGENLFWFEKCAIFVAFFFKATKQTLTFHKATRN